MQQAEVAKSVHTKFVLIVDIPFEKGSEVYSIVLNTWLFTVENTTWCNFPPRKEHRKFLKNKKVPESHWQKYKVLIIQYFDTHEEALRKEQRLVEYQSSTEDETFQCRTRKPQNRRFQDYASSCSSSSSMSPPPMPHSNADVTEDANIYTSTAHVLYGPTSDLNPGLNSTHEITEAPLTEFSIKEVAETTITKDFLEQVVKDITKCLVLLETHTERLVRIEKKLNTLPSTPRSEEEFSVKMSQVLPFNVVDDLEEFDTKLTDGNFKSAFLKFLSHIDGKDERHCIFRCLTKVFSVNLSPSCGWTTRNNNFSVKNLNIISVIKDSVQVCYPNLSQHVYEQAVKDWFRSAHQRLIRSEKQ